MQFENAEKDAYGHAKLGGIGDMISAKLKEPNAKERKFDDVVSDAEKAAVLVLVY